MAFSFDEEVAGCPWDSRVLPPPPLAGVPLTANSNSEYPYAVARWVPFIRMYRPVPVTARSSVPPSPVVVEKMFVHVVPSGDVWIWYARP